MTDRELLELAAKAAGVDVYESTDGTMQNRPILVCSAGGGMGTMPYDERWNPCVEDAQALRLAVRLNEFEPYKSRGGFRLSPGLTLDQQRHAIVRAAAEIGKGIVNTLDRNGLPEDNYYKSMAEAEELGRLDEIGKQMQPGD